jgi:hypothetical protein
MAALCAFELCPVPRGRWRWECTNSGRFRHCAGQDEDEIDVVPLHDRFDKEDARIIAAGAPDRSILLHREWMNEPYVCCQSGSRNCRRLSNRVFLSAQTPGAMIMTNNTSRITRRSLLAAASTSAAAWPFLNLPVAIAADRRITTADYPLKLGIASGDPAPDGVVLWTRLAPDPLNGGGSDGAFIGLGPGESRRQLGRHRWLLPVGGP